MARLFSSGFELNSVVDGVEFTIGNLVDTSSTTVRSGAYSGRVSGLNSVTASNFGTQYFINEIAGNVYTRIYFRVATLPSAENRIILFNDNSGLVNPPVYLTLDNLGTLKLYDEDGQISGTTALSTNTWYRIEVHIDTTLAGGSMVVEARIDGAAAFASSSTRNIDSANLPYWLHFGGNLNLEAQTTGDWFFDDIAVNDNSGSVQNSWPGEGKIVHLRPTAAGDNAADSGTFADIDEVTPNDATDFINLDNLTSVGDYNVENSSVVGLSSSDIVSLVSIGVRMREETATGTSYQLRLKSAASGTTSTSTPTDAGNTTWRTNFDGASAVSFTHKLISYTDPTTGVAWTPAGANSLDNMQIGVANLDADNIDVSTLWALVEYIENSATLGTDYVNFSFSTPTFTKTHTTNSLKRTANTKTHTTDSNKRLATIKTHTTSANKKLSGITKTHTTDSLKRVANTRTFSTDAFKRGGITKTHTADSNKRAALTRTHTTSSNKKVAALTKTHTTDGNKKAAGTKFFVTDANKYKAFTATHTTNANKRLATVRTHTTDSNKKAGITRAHTTDSNKRLATIKTHTTNANRITAFLKSHTTDANTIYGLVITWVSPPDLAIGVSNVEPLVFIIPVSTTDIHFHMQIDTANTFNVALQEFKSWEDQTNWEYWNGSAWTAVPVAGVDPSYAGNQARYTPSLASGTYYRRVRGRVVI